MRTLSPTRPRRCSTSCCKGSHGRALRLEASQLIAVAAKSFERELGVSGIILGTARREGLTILGERRRIDWEQDEEVVLLQRIDQGSGADFQTHGDRRPAKRRSSGPLLDGLGPIQQDAEFPLATIGWLQTDIVFGIGPADANESRKFDV
jgi:hypothetical protein